MSTTPGPSSRSAIGNTPRVYPPDLQPLLQSILAVLADIDFVHESEVTIIRDSDADEWLKQSVIRTGRAPPGAACALPPAACGHGGAHPGARRLTEVHSSAPIRARMVSSPATQSQEVMARHLFMLPLQVNPVYRNVAVAFCDEGWAIDRMSYRWATVSREDHNGRRSGSATTPPIIAKAAGMSPTRP